VTAAPARTAEPAPGAAGPRGVSRSRSLLDRGILRHAVLDALKKFHPRAQVKNPVMFVVLIGSSP